MTTNQPRVDLPGFATTTRHHSDRPIGAWTDRAIIDWLVHYADLPPCQPMVGKLLDEVERRNITLTPAAIRTLDRRPR